MSDKDNLLRDWYEPSDFPLSFQPEGEAKIPFHKSNPVLDFNYTQEKCSALRLFPLNAIKKFTCEMKGNLKIAALSSININFNLVQKFERFNISAMKIEGYWVNFGCVFASFHLKIFNFADGDCVQCIFKMPFPGKNSPDPVDQRRI